MKYLFLLIITLIVILAATAVVVAQPGLPSDPAQAPIDGGLGLLAAAGGVCAWQKLKKDSETK